MNEAFSVLRVISISRFEHGCDHSGIAVAVQHGDHS
jgi:hypothetical protein